MKGERRMNSRKNLRLGKEEVGVEEKG